MTVSQFIARSRCADRNDNDASFLTFFKNVPVISSAANYFLCDAFEESQAASELLEALFKDKDIRLLSARALKWGELGRIYDALVAKRYPSSFSILPKNFF